MFLLPVYLFALAQLPQVETGNALLVFFILHLLVYPSSNGYNSYMDRDESPIGGLASPLQPTRQLYHASLVMDATALVLSLLVSRWFALGILLYILASRAYSYRGIRLKRYPYVGFLTVFVFQGAAVFWLSYHGCHPERVLEVPLLPCFISSLLIGALYPLTQVYQHREDRLDGVVTISMALGKRGTFIFSMMLFLSATFFMYRLLFDERAFHFYLFLAVMLPVVLFFLYWMRKVWKDESAADFRNSLTMNLMATLCTTVYFSTLIILSH
jgi:1,4-dihydroxy-2-naphthoate octaprenyltransferase